MSDTRASAWENGRGRPPVAFASGTKSLGLRPGVEPKPSVASEVQYEFHPYRLSLYVRLLPIMFFQGYLTLTVLLFAYGPWPWPVKDGTKLYLFLAAAHLSLLFGYLSGAFKTPYTYKGRWNVKQLVFASAILTIIMIFPTSYFRTGTSFPDITVGLNNLGRAYSDSMKLRMENVPIVEYIRMLFSVPLFMLVPLAVYYWRVISPLNRLLAFLGIFGTLMIYIAAGVNKGFADLVLILPWMLLVNNCSTLVKLISWRIVRLLLIFGLIFTLFFAFYSGTMSSRQGSYASYGYFRYTRSRVNNENVFLQFVPKSMHVGVSGLILYLSHGYYGLYLSLDKPFVPMYGVGNSMFLFRR